MTTQVIADHDFENLKTLQDKLMSLPEESRFDDINIILNQNSLIGLKLANAVLKNKKYFEILLERGLERANASSIELWLKYLLPRLGYHRVIDILSEKLNSEHRQQVAKASYWLPKFLPKGDEKAEKLLTEFWIKEKQTDVR
jgi:hypothetical protein